MQLRTAFAARTCGQRYRAQPILYTILIPLGNVFELHSPPFSFLPSPLQVFRIPSRPWPRTRHTPPQSTKTPRSSLWTINHPDTTPMMTMTSPSCRRKTQALTMQRWQTCHNPYVRRRLHPCTRPARGQTHSTLQDEYNPHIRLGHYH